MAVEWEQQEPEEALANRIAVHLSHVANDLAACHQRVGGDCQYASKRWVFFRPFCLVEEDEDGRIKHEDRDQS